MKLLVMSYTPRLKQEFNERIVGALKKSLAIPTDESPTLDKIVISRGVGAAVADKKLIDHAVEELTAISGQKAVPTISKKDVASFKLRKGMPIGAKFPTWRTHVRISRSFGNCCPSTCERLSRRRQRF